MVYRWRECRRRILPGPTCQKSVPESIIAFLESDSFEDAIRKVISLGGDTDTMGAITGSIAWTYYRFRGGLTEEMRRLQTLAEAFLPVDFRETVAGFDHLCREK